MHLLTELFLEVLDIPVDYRDLGPGFHLLGRPECKSKSLDFRTIEAKLVGFAHCTHEEASFVIVVFRALVSVLSFVVALFALQDRLAGSFEVV